METKRVHILVYFTFYVSAVCGWVVDWKCSEMHFELMEVDSCLTVLQSDVVVGEKGPGRNVKRSADSFSSLLQRERAPLFPSVRLSICSYLFLSASVGLGACTCFFF